MKSLTHLLCVAILAVSTAMACSSDSGSAPDGSTARLDGRVPGADGPGGPGADGGRPIDGAAKPDAKAGCVPACGPNQLCESGSCKDLPTQCPCPIESYCDLANNRCVAGCLSDDDCKTGRYCDGTKHCQDGCRVGTCGLNEVCSSSTRTCTCATGYHRCGGACVKEDVNSCGASCQVCPTDPQGKTTCQSGACKLACNAGHESCGGVCAACPTQNATAFTCQGTTCEASQCQANHHVCSGSCELEDASSCGASCDQCKDAVQGACSAGACYEVVDIGYYPKLTSCAERCAAMGKTCGDSCDVHYTRPNGTKYNYVTAGMYTQQGAYQPYGFFAACTDKPPTGINSYRCCCTEKLTGTPTPGCTKHTDCGASEFCWAAKGECYPTTDSRCPPGYTYKGSCSSGSQICTHGGLPTGTVFKFAADCPAGTTYRGGYYCSDLTKVCVPDQP